MRGVISVLRWEVELIKSGLKVGDSVMLSSGGGPVMVVIEFLPESHSLLPGGARCKWYNQERRECTALFQLEDLVRLI
jgi:uncharacterized protein YodC (DUF2158 family)